MASIIFHLDTRWMSPVVAALSKGKQPPVLIVQGGERAWVGGLVSGEKVSSTPAMQHRFFWSSSIRLYVSRLHVYRAPSDVSWGLHKTLVCTN
jgi:hypothetical protein